MTDEIRTKVNKSIWATSPNKLYSELSAENRKLLRENDCRDMIDSILAYSPWNGNTTAEEILQMEERGYHNYLARYIDGDQWYGGLGRTRVLELIAEQMADIDHIESNTYTDSEGVTYNTIIWKNER